MIDTKKLIPYFRWPQFIDYNYYSLPFRYRHHAIVSTALYSLLLPIALSGRWRHPYACHRPPTLTALRWCQRFPELSDANCYMAPDPWHLADGAAGPPWWLRRRVH